MQKWLLILALALLVNAMHAQAEEDIYFTNQSDRYYHLDENCDRPAETNWWDDVPVEYYEREIYQKKPISEAAALEFDKIACPICVNAFQPAYLGDHFPDWPYEADPWEISGMEPQQEQEFWNARPQAYIDEIMETGEAFNAYYDTVYKPETDTHDQKHPYPVAYAGRYSSNSGCTAYAIVNPDEETIAAFKRMFGGGAWIVPAKYGYNEIMQACEQVVEALQAWCFNHPEVDAKWVSSSGPDYENCAVIGITGADWKQAAAAMEETAPIYIHFVPDEPAQWL